MNTKTTRTVDPQGRVSIPGYLRELVGINPGDTVTVEARADNTLRIYASDDRCCICGEIHAAADMLTVTIGTQDHTFCINCARTIVAKLGK